MDNKFMTSREEELFLENQQLKSQLAAQEVELREFMKSSENKQLRNDSDNCVYLAVEDHPYEVSALLIGDQFVMPSLNFKDNGNLWDNDKYLYHQLLPLLRRYCNKNLFESDTEVLELLKKDIPEDDFCRVLELLEQAESLGLFKNI